MVSGAPTARNGRGNVAFARTSSCSHWSSNVVMTVARHLGIRWSTMLALYPCPLDYQSDCGKTSASIFAPHQNAHRLIFGTNKPATDRPFYGSLMRICDLRESRPSTNAGSFHSRDSAVMGRHCNR